MDDNYRGQISFDFIVIFVLIRRHGLTGFFCLYTSGLYLEHTFLGLTEYLEFQLFSWGEGTASRAQGFMLTLYNMNNLGRAWVDHRWCQGLILDRLHARQVSYLRDCVPSPLGLFCVFGFLRNYVLDLSWHVTPCS